MRTLLCTLILATLGVASVIPVSHGHALTPITPSVSVSTDLLGWRLRLDEQNTFAATGARLAASIPLSELLRLELDLGVGGSETLDFADAWGPFQVETRLESLLGAHLRTDLPLSPQLTVNASVGYSRAEFLLTESAPGVARFSETLTEQGLSFGLGLDAQLTQSLWLGIGYRHILDKPGVKMTGYTAGLRWHF